MKDQHTLIKGYRDLSQDEIDIMNAIKEMGASIEATVDSVATLNDVDQRWVAIARTDFQTALMALVRAVAKPESF